MRDCWDIRKDCPFPGTDPAVASCPVYASQVPCWEFDWIGFYRGMPAGPEKEEWKRMMLDWCARCAVRESHPEAVDTLLETLGRSA